MILSLTSLLSLRIISPFSHALIFTFMTRIVLSLFISSLTFGTSGHANRLPPGMSTVNTSTTKTQPSNNGWSDAALDFVDEVTRNAQWELLYAKVVDFVEEAPSGRRIPRIELVDTNGDCEVDIATAIVEAGHAVWSDENRS